MLFPVPQCHVSKQKECQGFLVPRLYHSALSLKCSCPCGPDLCAVESSAAPLHRPSRRFGFLVTRGWIWAGSSVFRPVGCRRTCLFLLWISFCFLSFFFKLVRVFSLAPALKLPFSRPILALVFCHRMKCAWCLDALDLCFHMFMCLCLRVRVLGHIHQSTLPQTSGASPLMRAAQSPNLIAHTHTQTNLHTTVLHKSQHNGEKSALRFSHLLYFHFKIHITLNPLFPVGRSSLYSGPKVDIF